MATNIIAMNRGDTYTIIVDMTSLGTEQPPYELLDGDAIYFGLMDPNQPFEEALIKKKITAASSEVTEEGNVIIPIYPEDTLDLLPGRYFYMIKLKMDHYDEYSNHIVGVKTLINKTKFIIYD